MATLWDRKTKSRYEYHPSRIGRLLHIGLKVIFLPILFVSALSIIGGCIAFTEMTEPEVSCVFISYVPQLTLAGLGELLLGVLLFFVSSRFKRIRNSLPEPYHEHKVDYLWDMGWFSSQNAFSLTLGGGIAFGLGLISLIVSAL